MFNKCEIHPHNVLPIHTSGSRSAVSVPPKESKILKSTKWKEVTWTLPRIDISDEDFNRSGAVKQLGPLVRRGCYQVWSATNEICSIERKSTFRLNLKCE